MKKPNAEVMEARVRELIETGKSKGVLTYKEIVEMLGDVELDSEQFDRILDTLSGLNIDAVSYTHLDVYKRQPSRRSSCPAALTLPGDNDGIACAGAVFTYM